MTLKHASKCRVDAAEAARAKREAIAEALAQIEKENKARDEKKAEAEAEKAAKQFDDDLKRGYFKANAGASELDWLRDKKTLKGEAMRKRALDGLADQNSIKASLLRRGNYQPF